MDIWTWLDRHPVARLACVSAAMRRGLDVLHPPEQMHISLPKHYGGPAPKARVHRSRPLVPAGAGDVESVPDMLAHAAQCLPRIEALVVWESAIHRGLVTASTLRRTAWRSSAARAAARVVSPSSESLLETIAFHRLSDAGIESRQQVSLLGHRVDLLIAERIVVQLDGFGFHSSPADRRRDIEHDARLQLDGRIVLRFDYQKVIHGWDEVLAVVRHARAQIAA